MAENGAKNDFILKIHDNSNGWGPQGIPEQFKELPFQHFNKADKIGKIADWTGQLYSGRGPYGLNQRYANQYNSNQGQAGAQYAYYHDEEDANFQLVDSSRPQKTAMQRANKMKQMQFYKKIAQKEKEKKIAAGYYTPNQRQGGKFNKEQQRQYKQWQKRGNYGGGNRRYDQRGHNQKQRQPSCQIKHEWTVLEEMDFVRLSKLNLPGVKEGEDIEGEQYGTLEYYDKTYDRITTRSDKPLVKTNRPQYFNLTTKDDPVMEQLARSKVGNVYATDQILANLMCCTRSVNSWDIIVNRIGEDTIFFDKRDKSDLDYLTVSETATDPPSEEGNSLNSPKNLGLEATFINRNFAQQVLKKDETYEFEHTQVPFVDEGDDISDLCSVGYKYRKFNLAFGGGEYKVVVRTEIDGVMQSSSGKTEFLTIKAFNEWDSRYCGGEDWRAKLESQKGALLATEMKNNSFKLAKWTVQALLAGTDQMKFGYVSRAHNRDSKKHVILGTQQFTPNEFAKNITLKMENSWGILKVIIDRCMEQPTGKYLIMKDPNKGTIRLYKLPEGTFTSSESEGDDDDDDDEDEEDGDDEADDDGN